MSPSMSFSLPRRAAVGLAAVAGLAAMWGGLARLGWTFTRWDGREIAWHGALAVLGFLGTLIAAERATALGRSWAFGAPLASGLGAISLLTFSSPRPGQVLFLLGALVLVGIFWVIYRLQPALHNGVLGIGSVLWAASVGLWFGGFALYRIAPWWAGLLVATIVGERLELSRVTGLRTASRRTFLVSLLVFLGGLVVSLASFGAGVRMAGAGLVALAVWLARNDVARRTIRGSALTRFMAACLLAGYVWLFVGGVLWLWFGGVLAGAHHDAMLHAVFVGFVMSMVFGHAPVILPAVLGGRIGYRSRFYVHLALLHASLALRIAGDLAGVPAAIRWGGALSAAAILLFALSTAAARRGGTSIAKEVPIHV
jgi:hypothetical protein